MLSAVGVRSPLSRPHSPSLCPAVSGPDIGTLGVSHSCFSPEISWCSMGRFCTHRKTTMAICPGSFPCPTAAADSWPYRVLGKWQGPTAAVWNKQPYECLAASGRRVPQVPHICKLFCVCLVHPEHAGVVVQPTQATLDMLVSASKPFCICKVVSILCFKPCDHNDVGHNSSCIKPIFSDTHFSFYQPLVREIHNSYIDGFFLLLQVMTHQ